MKTNFSFLKDNYLGLYQLAILGERNCYSDPSTTLSKLRILSEKLTSIQKLHLKLYPYSIQLENQGIRLLIQVKERKQKLVICLGKRTT